MSLTQRPHLHLQAAKLRIMHRHGSMADHLHFAHTLLAPLHLSAVPCVATSQPSMCLHFPTLTSQVQSRAGVSLLRSCSALQSEQEGSPALQEVPEAGKVLLWEQQRDHLLKHLSRAQTRAALRRM